MEKTKLTQHLTRLKKFDTERKGWLILSAFVVVSVIGTIFNWKFIIDEHLVWLIVASGLTLAVCWWFWTMKLIRHLLESKTVEYEILDDLVITLRDIKEDVKKSMKSIDK
jgi:membrane protein YdbS with pleckstrin-like domain